MKQRATRNALLAIVVLGGFLRAYHIGGKGLWLDEAFSVWMGWQPVKEMLGWLVRIDQHPPLYYLLLHFWMHLGDDPATVRALSALCSTLTIPVIYLLGRRLADAKVGLLAALLLAISPFHVRLAQEARMYALLALNASLALYTLTRLLDIVPDPRVDKCETPNPKTRTLAWLGYTVFTAAMLWTHNTAIFFPLAANLIVLGLLLTRKRAKPRNWLLAQLVVFLLWSPWLPALTTQSIGVYDEFWLPAPNPETVAGVVGTFVSDLLPLPPVGILAVGVPFVGLALAGLAYFRRRPLCILFLLIIFATPFVSELLVSLRRPIFYDRTLIWASIPLYLLLAAGMRRLRRRARILAIVLVLTVNTLSLETYYVRFEKEQWDDAAALVAERMATDDLILFNATWAQLPFDYYFHRLYNHPAAEHGAPVDLFDRGVLEPKMTARDLPRLRGLLQGRERVWLIYSHNWYTDPEGLIPAELEKELDLRGRCDFVGLQVQLYDKR